MISLKYKGGVLVNEVTKIKSNSGEQKIRKKSCQVLISRGIILIVFGIHIEL